VLRTFTLKLRAVQTKIHQVLTNWFGILDCNNSPRFKGV